MAKIIVFSNLKGGTGKSTVCVHFANYLSINNGQNVAVFDADPQQSITNLREREKKTNPDVDVPWPVIQLAGQKDTKSIIGKIRKVEGWALIDSPGTLQSPNLLEIFKSADAVVIPFRYDDFVVDSTITFVKVLRKSGINTPIFFLPNCIDRRIKQRNEESVSKILSKAGHILPRIGQSVHLQRMSTLQITNLCQPAYVGDATEELIKNI